jgi:hypothetical protein
MLGYGSCNADWKGIGISAQRCLEGMVGDLQIFGPGWE